MIHSRIDRGETPGGGTKRRREIDEWNKPLLGNSPQRFPHALHALRYKEECAYAAASGNARREITLVRPLKAFTDHGKRVRREDPRIY